MFQHSLAFDRGEYLWLLLLVPWLWWLSYSKGGLAGLGRWRRLLALLLRSAVFIFLILALADVQYQRKSDRLTVFYLLDQSLSIPARQRQAMIDYVNASIDAQRSDEHQDRVGVIVFGHTAAVEIPPVDFDVHMPSRIETQLDPQYTDLALAIQRAQAMFPYDTAGRIVLVTDGNQNLGDALEEAREAVDLGVSIDVVPVLLSARNEVAVEKIDIPPGVRRGQPFDLRVVLQCDRPVSTNATRTTENKKPPANTPGDSEASVVVGRLRLVRKSGQQEQIISDQQVQLPPGKRVFTLREQIDQSDFYTYEARFIPTDPNSDGMTQNNLATAFTHVRGRGHVLLIENWNEQGVADSMVRRLRQEEIEVTVLPSDHLYTSLAELQRYDSVILAGVSRSAGSAANTVVSFSDAQIDMLVQNTRELGCGLIMIGGPDSYGAGGWTGTELEKAMPVDFQIKSAKVVPVGALVLMMHAGEMPQANYWQKRIAIESIKLLGNRDYCGLIQWNGTDQWLWGQSQGGMLPVGPARKMMLARVDQMTIGDMPAFDPALKMAASAFAGVSRAALKHMIVISDGDPVRPTVTAIRALVQQGVKVTTVAVGSHGRLGSQMMQNLAQQTGGKYYQVKSAKALPRIYQREARRVAKSLVYEPQPPVRPAIVSPHEIVQGLQSPLPPVSGFVLTTVKQNPLVEVILRSPKPVAEKNATILAAWTYGAGKVAALTTDAGQRWTRSWTGWEGYDKFLSQLVRWSMRPFGDTGNFSVATHTQDGQTQIIVTALDENEEFLNDQSMSATVIAPDMSSRTVPIDQTAPGRYVGNFPSQATGSYLIMVHPGAGRAALRTGVNVGYSVEYLDHETNMALLKSLAGLVIRHGEAGVLTEPGLDSKRIDLLRQENPFRHNLPPVVTGQSVWPLMVLIGSCLFFTDVFVRRVQVNFIWLLPLLGQLRDTVLRREREAPEPETIRRLQSRKQQLGAEIEGQRARTRLEPGGKSAGNDSHAASAVLQVKPGLPSGQNSPPQASTRPMEPGQTSLEQDEEAIEELYTERLLKAKKKLWRKRDQEGK